MTSTAAPQEFQFQAEIKQLLHLLSHSLYQNREIAIRELVSNASDALDKFRHVTLTDKQHEDGSPLAISIEPDEAARVLTIRDNGIGMTKDELVQNLGTIAHSGSLEYLSRLEGDAKKDLSLIGQFGVGFYSAFMLAARVEVLSRSCHEASGWRWESDGTGRFTIEPAEGLERGTQVRLHLHPDRDEFLRPFRLKYILNEYSTFVPWPIRLEGELVNDQKPIWVEPKSQVTDEQYTSFYRYLSKRTTDLPLWHLHLTADLPFQFHAILYCPMANMELLGFGRNDHGLHLCARRILVQSNCRELLPEYLRFMYGLVDSADLPLNVSREALQDNTVFRKIKRVLIKKVLTHLEELARDDADTYRSFYLQFGGVLREGAANDFDNSDAIMKLLRFKSSYGADRFALVSFADYISRMPAGQKQIYYVGGPDIAALERNPHLEAFRSRGIEVFYLTDPVDEFVLNRMQQYEDRRLLSIDSSEVDFSEVQRVDDAASEAKESGDSPAEAAAGLPRVLELFRQVLGDKVEEVRESSRLTTSPCCLIAPKGAVSAHLQKVLSQASDEFPDSKRIMEINPKHPLLQRLSGLATAGGQDAFIQMCGLQLLSSALLMDGIVLDPHDSSSRMVDFMQQLAAQRTGSV